MANKLNFFLDSCMFVVVKFGLAIANDIENMFESSKLKFILLIISKQGKWT